MLAGETADLIWKRLNQLVEPGFGILKHRLAVADKQDIDVVPNVSTATSTKEAG